MDVMQLHVDFNFCAIKINVLPYSFSPMWSHVATPSYSMFLTPVVTCLYLLSCGYMHLPHHCVPLSCSHCGYPLPLSSLLLWSQVGYSPSPVFLSSLITCNYPSPVYPFPVFLSLVVTCLPLQPLCSSILWSHVSTPSLCSSLL